ncbi:transcriptional regulator GcvA [Aliagarivorans marinus]|uniref:transcriptional regulator GcvA n=1 Tax=Aliagarivorans marinus TaxID=561965 RepID=UPI00040F3836|nr:transcriptional regulator GcvA [Aliagarivorans marinus]
MLKLPPLEALRYFEAAARHLSFTAAADELCISQSAVSQKVIQLEERLGYKLFERKPRQLLLTQRGATLYPAVNAALLQIHDTLNDLNQSHQLSPVELFCMPSFASRWLLPRLSDFNQRYPEVVLHLNAQVSEPNFYQQQVDIGICHGVGDHPALEQVRLFRDYIYPVASPEYLESHPVNTPGDLQRCTLLHDALPQARLATSWQSWLNAIGMSEIDCSRGYRFNQADHIVRAALSGQGVALARHALVAREVAKGRLVPLLDHVIEDGAVYLVCLRKLLARPQIQAFISWIRSQAEEFENHHSVIANDPV